MHLSYQQHCVRKVLRFEYQKNIVAWFLLVEHSLEYKKNKVAPEPFV